MGQVDVQASTEPPLVSHPETPLSTPLTKKLFELVGLKFAPAPSTPNPTYGGLIENAAVSYCPSRRQPDGAYDRAVTLYTGAIIRPALDTSTLSAHSSAIDSTP